MSQGNSDLYLQYPGMNFQIELCMQKLANISENHGSDKLLQRWVVIGVMAPIDRLLTTTAQVAARTS